jgi:hypothetical protein
MVRRSDAHGGALESRHAHRGPAGPRVHPLARCRRGGCSRCGGSTGNASSGSGHRERNERAASRFGYCMASAIVDELRNSLE